MSFASFTLIELQGLQSEQGKPLNGGYGIVIGEPSMSECGNLRFPTRIFHTPGSKLLKKPLDMNVKESNLRISPTVGGSPALEYFMEAMNEYVPPYLQNIPRFKREILFWLSAAHKVVPTAFQWGISYAGFLSSHEGRKHEAAQIALDIIEKYNITADPSQGPAMCHKVVEIFCDAKEHMRKALECALFIPQDTPEHRSLARRSFRLICDTCTKHFISPNYGIRVDEHISINLLSAKILAKLSQNNADDLHAVAAAYCLAGKNLEGAKCYFQCLDNGKPLREIETSIILALMQCPGMPLEHHHVFLVNGDKAQCAPTEHLDKIQIDATLGQVTTAKASEPVMKIHTIPTSKDDPIFYDLLKQNFPERLPKTMKCEIPLSPNFSFQFDLVKKEEKQDV